MKQKVYSGNEERAILTAMVVHDGVLAKIYERVRGAGKPFTNRWCNLIALWCFEHFKKFGHAPRQYLQVRFDQFAKSTKDEDTIELLETFLSGLSEDYEALAKEVNAPFICNLAGTYFEKVRLERLASDLQTALENNDLEAAKQTRDTYQPVDFSDNTWQGAFDANEIKQTFTYYEEDRSLVQFRGDLGKFLSAHFERDGFICFQGPEKRGKSFWLLETVVQAIRQRRKTLYIVLGDMGADQVRRRLYQRICANPFTGGEYAIPTKLIVRAVDDVDLKARSNVYEPLSTKTVLRAKERLKQLTAMKQVPLKMMCTGGGVYSAGDLEQEVAKFCREGWIPDVIVVDYADELGPEAGTEKQDKRHQTNETWRVLRRISLANHLLVVTATQAAARSYDRAVIRKKDFSEDKRKNAHITGMIGINQTSQEKVLGIYRLNWLFLRDGAWADYQMCWTAGNLALACPCIISKLPAKQFGPKKGGTQDNDGEQDGEKDSATTKRKHK